MKRKDHPNAKRWLKPPTIEQIDAAVAKAGVCDAHFENYHGIYEGAIKRVRQGKRQMPVQYWHLFLDISPLRGAIGGAKVVPSTTHPAIPRTKPSKDNALGRLVS